MSVKWEKEEGTNNGKLTFEIEPAKIKEGLDTAFNRVKKTLNVPGFVKVRFLVRSLTKCLAKNHFTKML